MDLMDQFWHFKPLKVHRENYRRSETNKKQIKRSTMKKKNLVKRSSSTLLRNVYQKIDVIKSNTTWSKKGKKKNKLPDFTPTVQSFNPVSKSIVSRYVKRRYYDVVGSPMGSDKPKIFFLNPYHSTHEENLARSLSPHARYEKHRNQLNRWPSTTENLISPKTLRERMDTYSRNLKYPPDSLESSQKLYDIECNLNTTRLRKFKDNHLNISKRQTISNFHREGLSDRKPLQSKKHDKNQKLSGRFSSSAILENFTPTKSVSNEKTAKNISQTSSNNMEKIHEKKNMLKKVNNVNTTRHTQRTSGTHPRLKTKGKVTLKRNCLKSKTLIIGNPKVSGKTAFASGTIIELPEYEEIGEKLSVIHEIDELQRSSELIAQGGTKCDLISEDKDTTLKKSLFTVYMGMLKINSFFPSFSKFFSEGSTNSEENGTSRQYMTIPNICFFMSQNQSADGFVSSKTSAIEEKPKIVEVDSSGNIKSENKAHELGSLNSTTKVSANHRKSASLGDILKMGTDKLIESDEKVKMFKFRWSEPNLRDERNSMEKNNNDIKSNEDQSGENDPTQENDLRKPRCTVSDLFFETSNSSQSATDLPGDGKRSSGVTAEKTVRRRHSGLKKIVSDEFLSLNSDDKSVKLLYEEDPSEFHSSESLGKEKSSSRIEMKLAK